MTRPATTWARGTGERTDLDAADCLPEGCDPVAALTGTTWLGDGNALAPDDPDCVGTDEGGPCLDRSLDVGLPGPESDAIIKARVLWTNGYETEGQVFRVGQNPPTPEPGDFSTIGEVTGGFTFVPTGGRDNGGHVLTVESAPGLTQADNVGNYMWLPLAPGETPPRGAGQHHAFNYFGVPLPRPHNAIGFGSNTGSGPFFPSVLLQVSDADYKVRAMKVGVDGGGLATLTPIGSASDVAVPADGWWSLEPQAYVAPSGNTEGGFVIARLYTESGDPEGETVVFEVGADLEGDGHHGYAWGSEVCRRNSVGISGIGLDDSVVYGPYGVVKRWLGDTRVGVAVPAAAGDETNSAIGHDSRRLYTVADPQTIGALVTHGLADRWRNVTGAIARALDELTVGLWWFGQTSIFSGSWLYGPNPYDGVFVPANYQNTAEIAAIGAIPRNRFADALGDLYRVVVTRTNIAVVEGVMPYARTAAVWVKGTLGTGPASPDGGGPGTFQLEGEAATPPEFSVVSPHMNDGIDASAQRNFRPRVKSGGVESTLPVLGAARFAADSSAIGSRWQTILGYSVAPYLFQETDPGTDLPFQPAAIPAIQVGAVGDFTEFDLVNPTPGAGERWLAFDLAEAGADFAYHPVASTLTEHGPFAPRAGFAFTGATDLPARHVVIRDASTDWDGSLVELLVDWGDGSDPEAIVQGGTLAHDYAAPGTYTITLAVLDSDGLADSVSHDAAAFVVNEAPVAAFGVIGDVGDLTGQTADFEDASTDDDAVITWDWDFGDGSMHSALQNPSHVYAAPGTYAVVLTVTDGGGEAGQPALSDSTSADIDVPFDVAPAGCGLSADALADAPFVQGDDFHGGNPPLPAYANTAGLDAYLLGGNFRETYDLCEAGGAGVDHALDNAVQWNGHATFRMDFGAGKFGAGWLTVLTDDADPVENYYVAAPFGPTGYWFRWLGLGDVGVMSDAGATTAFSGLTVLHIDGRNVEFALNVRADAHLWLDVSVRPISDGHAFVVTSFDLGLATQLFDGATFKELIAHYTSDLAARTSRVKFWMGDACSLAGAAPTYDTGDLDSHIGTSGTALTAKLALSGVQGHLERNFTPSGATKSVWTGLWEGEPDTVSANPYGVGSP